MNAQEKQAYLDRAVALEASMLLDVEMLRVRRDNLVRRMDDERNALVEKMNGLVERAEASHENARALVAQVEAIEVEEVS